MGQEPGLRLLIVDDDVEINEFTSMKLRLEAPHFSIVSLYSASECLKYLQENSADCILSDYQMPGMDGMKLLGYLRDSGDRTPFIFLTGQGTEEVARQAFINGASDYFTKEIGFAHFTRIINSIEQAVKRRRSEENRKKAEDALRNTAEGVSALTGATFFRSLVEYLARSLGAAYAFVGTVTPYDPDRFVTVSVYAKGNIADNFEYTIEGTPCAGVVAGELCSYPEKVRERFPGVRMLADMGAESYIGAPLFDPAGQPIGILAVLDTKPIVDEELMGLLLRIFATRAAAELERRRQDNALLESEAKFRGLVEDSMVGVVIVQDERFVYCNPSYAGILGYTPEELMPMDSVLTLVHPDDRALVKENIRRRVSGEVKSITYSFRMVRKDGGAVDVEVHGSFTLFNGRPAVVASMLDITERKAAHEALVARNQELYALNGVAEVIANTPDLGEMLRLVLDKVLSMPFMNIQKKGVIFISDEQDPDTLSMAAHIGISEEIAERESRIKTGWCICGRAAQTGETIVSLDCREDTGHTMSYPGMQPHGHLVVPILSKEKVLGVVTLYTEPGVPVMESDRRLITGVAHQLSVAIENHRLFDRIARAKKEWEDTFDAIEDMVTIHDHDYTILRANKAVTRTFGKPEQDIIGKKCYEVFHGSNSPAGHCPAHRISDRADRHTYYEYEQDGRYYQTSAFPIGGGIGKGTLVHIVKDVTEQKKLEEQLLHSQKMESIGQLAGGIAHDYNNITATIMACANVLELRMDEGDRLRTYVEQILLSTERATRLTKGLLAFGRKQLINASPVELNALVSGSTTLLASLIGEDIRVSVETYPIPLTVMADHTQLEQVLMNLSTNARDAMEGPGSITISTDTAVIDDDYIQKHGFGRRGSFGRITFSDDGRGIDPDAMGSIFEPFFTTKDVGRGTGLGLSIVYGIIKQHGGFINAASKPGAGTTFSIYLPLVNVVARADEEGRAQGIKGGSETILIAEDDESLRRITAEVLESFGYRVITAVDGLDAWEKFSADSGRVDLMLIDVVMPNMNGKQLYDLVKEVRPDIKTLFMSGYTDHVMKLDEMGGHAPEILAKPASSEEILRKVRELLDG